MKLSQAAEKVISLATAIQEYWDRELPKRYANYPLVAPGEDSGPPPPEEAELREFLESLPTDDLHKLALPIYLSIYGGASFIRQTWRKVSSP